MQNEHSNRTIWIIWICLTLLMGGYLIFHMSMSEEKDLFLIGEASHGHYQIELACESCHTEAFGGKEVLQNACTQCHAEELSEAHDSHPKKKFTDPRNADRVAILDARYCTTCHQEHQQEKTGPMGVTLPDDFCYQCHKDIAKDRPSHKDMAFNSCDDAGCHNYHDNRALYEDFLVKHAHEPAIKAFAAVPAKTALSRYIDTLPENKKALISSDANGGAYYRPDIIEHWQASAHARVSINCSDCHQKDRTEWIEKPTASICTDCHEGETNQFMAGKHGMRLSSPLHQAMTPGDARLEFKTDAANNEQSCLACHNDHAMNTATAAVEVCMSCHDDQHSRAYPTSPHAALWQKEQRGEAAIGTGVSCATCHMPRMVSGPATQQQVSVQHNQNDNLRPNEKMIRPVCMNCHSLAFSIDALADPTLINNNFSGQPADHIESIDMAVKRAH